MGTRSKRRYVVCLSNEGYAASLEVRKLYVRVADPHSERHGMVRVVDESGQDYLYPQRYFAEVSLSSKAEKALRLSA
jgi:hypothetical protein